MSFALCGFSDDAENGNISICHINGRCRTTIAIKTTNLLVLVNGFPCLITFRFKTERGKSAASRQGKTDPCTGLRAGILYILFSELGLPNSRLFQCNGTIAGHENDGLSRRLSQFAFPCHATTVLCCYSESGLTSHPC